jgi:myo-inositol catabolism protein IolC
MNVLSPVVRRQSSSPQHRLSASFSSFPASSRAFSAFSANTGANDEENAEKTAAIEVLRAYTQTRHTKQPPVSLRSAIDACATLHEPDRGALFLSLAIDRSKTEDDLAIGIGDVNSVLRGFCYAETPSNAYMSAAEEWLSRLVSDESLPSPDEKTYRLLRDGYWRVGNSEAAQDYEARMRGW